MSQSNFAVSFVFKDIFPDIDSFKTYLETYTNVDKTDILNVYLYKYLLNTYANSNVNYDTIDAFMRHFGLTYENNFSQFKFRKMVIDAQYNLTENDLATIQTAFENMASNPNTELLDPLNNALTYIGQQNASKMNENKLIAYLRAIDKVTTKYLDDFVNKFINHFMRILIDQTIIYEEE